MSDRSEEFLHLMALIRATEESLLELYSEGLLRGTVHTCIGQEACAVGVVSAIDPARDILYSNHRGHGHYLAYCRDVRGLVAEVMGLPAGVCGGVGGSQHLQRGNFYSNGIQGAGAPVAVGMALAERFKGRGSVTLAFLGDGTFGEGVVYESFNLAALWSAPVLYVVEHNGYAQSTPAYDQHAGRLEERAAPFGIPVRVADGMDVAAVHEIAVQAIADVRAGCGPQLLFLNTYRFSPHSKGDDYRDPGEIERQRRRDPIQMLGSRLGEERALNVMRRARSEVAAVIAELKAS